MPPYGFPYGEEGGHSASSSFDPSSPHPSSFHPSFVPEEEAAYVYMIQQEGYYVEVGREGGRGRAGMCGGVSE